MLRTRSVHRVLSLGVGLTALSGVIGACSGDEEQQIQLAKLSQGCSLNSQCENPLVCTFTRCHRECDADRDCQGEERCVKGETGNVCQLPVDTACTAKADCNGDQVCGVDGECRDPCTQASDCTTGQICANSGECASTDTRKDSVDPSGDIQPDPFDDTKEGGAPGSGGTSGAGGTSGTGGSSGTSAGTSGSGGSAGSGAVDAGPDTSTGGTGGADGSGGAGTGGTGGVDGSGGAGTGGTGGSVTDGGDADAGCPPGTGECDNNPSTVCETDFSLPTSCGACDVACNPQNGQVHCDVAAGYKCVVDSCTAGYDNCDDDGSNGCEARLSDNPNHCGRCGKNCGGGACANSLCGGAIVMDPGGPAANSTFYEMQLTGSRIVASILLSGSYELRTVTLPPTTPPSEGTVLHQFSSTSDRQLETLVADATHVFWSTAAIPYTVYRKPLDNPNANIESMFTAPTGGYIYELVATPTAFYYYGWIGATGYGLFSAAKTPGVSAQAISGLTGFYGSSNIGGFAVAGNRLFWATYNSTDTQYQLYSAPAGGGAPQIVDRTVQQSSYIGAVSDGTYVYWNTYAANGSIRRAAIATPAAVQDVALQVSYPDAGLAVDDTYVYFSDNSNGVWRSRKDGSEVKQRIASASGSHYLDRVVAVDAEYLYGPAYSGGAIVRISKLP